MDVKTAFLNGNLDEEIYMSQPEGFQEKDQEQKVCRLLKSIYGLKQDPGILDFMKRSNLLASIKVLMKLVFTS